MLYEIYTKQNRKIGKILFMVLYDEGIHEFVRHKIPLFTEIKNSVKHNSVWSDVERVASTR